MKTQGRSDSGGRIPPPHDDYDDYEEEELSAQDDLEVVDLADGDYEEVVETPAPPARANSRPGSNGNDRRAPDNGHATPPQERGGSRMRPPSNIGRPSTPPALPKRRPRPETALQGDVEVEAPAVPRPPAPPASRPPMGTGNGKRKGQNGNGAVAAATVQAPPTAQTLPPKSATRAPRSGVTTEALPPPQPETVPSRVFRLIVNYETLIFMIIFVLALVTRFWDLGNRGIHHDESLHAVFSRTLYTGGGYTHDPMMHGPIQFNLIASMYWLFGTTDATARFASAFCGVWVVMCPFFLRRQMGRWPALTASFLLLIAPGILYFSRMAREDSIFSAMEMIMVVGLWRFVSMRKPGDFFVFCAGLSLMFTIKESAYLTVAVLGIMFALLFAYQAGYAILGAFAGYGAAMGAMYLVISGKMKSGEIGQLPNIPSQNPDYSIISNFATTLLGHPLVQWAGIITVLFIASLIFLFMYKKRQVATWDTEYETEEAPVMQARPTRPATRASQVAMQSTKAPLPTRRPRQAAPDMGEASVPVAAAVNGHENGATMAAAETLPAPPAVDPVYAGSEPEYYEATEVWSPNRLDPKPGTLLAHYQPGSIPHLIGSLFGRPSVLLIGFLIAATIFIVFYSVFFTDLPRGIASGLFASLGYWMAQQGVARGGQPWYYYFVIIPLYQPIAVFFSVVATVFFGVKGIRGLLRNREERRYGENDEPGLGLYNTDRPVPFAKFSVFLPLFMIWWLAGAVFIYSWAGEKMPWLIMHMIRPAVLLASLFLGALVASIIARRNERLAWTAEYYGDDYEYTATPTMPLYDDRRRAVGAGGRSQAVRGALPSRRASSAERRAVPVVLREQAPPWITWNRPNSKFPAISFLAVFTLLALAWGMKLNALTAASAYGSWGYSWIYPILMSILIVSYAVWLGPSRVLRYAALGIFAVFFLYEFRSTINLSYEHPDVPIELATYVQTSPDVTRNVKEMNDYSQYVTGGNNIKVVYNWFPSWPYEWYLRDYKSKQFIDHNDPVTGPDVPIVILDYGTYNSSALENMINDSTKSAETVATLKALRDNYLPQRYAMRWWFPEEWYKNDLIQGKDYKTAPLLEQAGAIAGTTVGTFTNPEMTATLWKYLIFRDLPHPLGSEDMIVFVRKDIAQVYHYLQYQPPVMDDVPPATVRTPPPPDGSHYR